MTIRTVDLADLKAGVRPPERILALQAERDALSQAFQDYKREHGQIEQMLNEVLAAVPVVAPQVPVYKRPKSLKVNQGIAVVLHVTDAHHGAIQVADEIEGFGRFSPDLSRRRQFGFINDVLDWVELHRSAYDVREARFLVTGDLISGDIHRELQVTNAFPCPRQAVEAAEILAKQVAMAAPHFETVAVDMITDDNHGRLTIKPQAKEAGVNNWMYVIAHMAKMMLSEVGNVTFNIYAMNQKVVAVMGRRYLLCHGHDVMGWAGFPYYGIERRVAREAMKRMNGPDFTRFDKVVMGHWHAPLEHPHFLIGGSVSGTDAYDHKQGRHSAPQQVSWMVHPKWGEFDRTEWQLGKWDQEAARP